MTGALALGLLLPAAAQATFPGENGRLIFSTFALDDPPATGLDTVLYDGTGHTQIDVGAWGGQPAWSADGTRVAYVGDPTIPGGRPGYAFQLAVSDAAGLAPVKLTDFDDSKVAAPTWSPDGKHIAFVRAYQDETTQIHVLDLASGQSSSISGDNTEDGSPDWSPDGRRIAFETGGDVWIMDADGANRQRLTTDEAYDGAPSWSPDGSRLAFSSDREQVSEVWTMDADGKNATRFTYDPTVGDANPAWSPDGRRIAFTKGCNGFCAPSVWSQRLDGTGLTRAYNIGKAPDWQAIPAKTGSAGDPVTGTGGGGSAGTGTTLPGTGTSSITPTGSGTPPTTPVDVLGAVKRAKLSRASARRMVKHALRTRLGKRFTKRRGLKITLKRTSDRRFSGRVSWRVGKRRYTGPVTVRLTAAGIKVGSSGVRRRR